MTARISALSLLFLSSVLLLPALASPNPLPTDYSKATPIFPKDQIRPGMEGITYTVLQGNQIVPVHTVVLGIAKGILGPGLDMVIATLDDPKTRLTEAVHGMSGSPLYIDGKLVGALSHRIGSFEKDGQCGFTPIEDMLTIKDIMKARENAPVSPAPTLPADLTSPKTAFNSASFLPLAAPLSVSGVSPDLLKKLFAQFCPAQKDSWLVVPGGNAPSTAPAPNATLEEDPSQIRAGSPLAIVFMSGPIYMAGTGTCTWRQGNDIVAFGHPANGLGNCAYPMAEATIVTTLPSYERPYKLSNTGPIVGTILQDRAVAIAGVVGQIPPLATYSVVRTHDGQPDGTLEGSFVTDPDELPLMFATTLVGGLDGSIQSNHQSSIRVTGQLVLANHPPILVDDFVSGEGQEPLMEMALHALQPLNAVLGRKDEVVVPQKVELHEDQSEGLASWSIDSIKTDASVYAAGSVVNIQVRLKADYAAYQDCHLSLTLPTDVRSQHVTVRLANAGDLDERSLLPLIQNAQSIDQIINLYNGRRKINQLYAQLVVDSSGYVVNGAALPDLPDSIQDVVRDKRSTEQPSEISERVLAETSTPIPGVVRNSQELTIRVR